MSENESVDDDPIVAEIRAIREAHAKQFNYDLRAIVADLKRQERESGEVYVSYPPNRVSPPLPTNVDVPNLGGSTTQANS